MCVYSTNIPYKARGGGSAQRDLIGARGGGFSTERPYRSTGGGFSTNIIIKHGGGVGSVANNLL